MSKSPLHNRLKLSISLGSSVVAASKILNLILKIIISHLGVVNFGDYFISTSTFTSLTTLTLLGIPMSTTRFISFYNGRKQHQKSGDLIASAILIVVISALVVSIALLMRTHDLALYLDSPQSEPYFRILSFGLISASLTGLIRAIYLGYIYIKAAYVTDMIELTLKFIFTLIGIWVYKLGVVGAVLGYTVGTMLGALVNTIGLFKFVNIPLRSPRLSSQLIKYAWPVSLSEIITAISGTLLIFVVRIRGGGEQIGFYAAAVSIAALIHVLPQMILSVFLPVASTHHAKGKPINTLYMTLMMWLCVSVLVPVCIIALLGPYFTTLLFGKSYTGAGTILRPLSIAYGLYALFVWPNRQLLDMAGFTKENLMLTILRTATSIITLLYIIPKISGVGLAESILIGWVVEAIACVYLVRRKHLI